MPISERSEISLEDLAVGQYYWIDDSEFHVPVLMRVTEGFHYADDEMPCVNAVLEDGTEKEVGGYNVYCPIFYIPNSADLEGISW